MHRWTLILGVSGSSYRLGIPVLGSYAEETSPHGCLENPWDRYKGWRSLDSTCQESAGASFPPERAERGLPYQLPPCPAPKSKLSEHPGLLTPRPSLSLDLGQPGPGKRPNLGMQRWPRVLGCGLGREVEALVGA